MLVGASRNSSRYTSVDDHATLSTTINAIGDGSADDADSVEARESLKAKRERWIPIWLGVVDILVALGAGMTIKVRYSRFLTLLSGPLPDAKMKSNLLH